MQCGRLGALFSSYISCVVIVTLFIVFTVVVNGMDVLGEGVMLKDCQLYLCICV